MSDIIFVELKKKTLGDQNFRKYQVLRQSKKNKDKFYQMDETDYEELLQVIDEKRGQLPTKSRNSFEFVVRADTEEGWKTIKGYSQNSNFDNYLEYYEQRVKDGAKFYKTFDQFEIQIKYYK